MNAWARFGNRPTVPNLGTTLELGPRPLMLVPRKSNLGWTLKGSTRPTLLGPDVKPRRRATLSACGRCLADLHACHAEEGRQLLEPAAEMPKAHRTVMGRSLGVPIVKEPTGPNRESIPTVGIANF